MMLPDGRSIDLVLCFHANIVYGNEELRTVHQSTNPDSAVYSLRKGNTTM